MEQVITWQDRTKKYDGVEAMTKYTLLFNNNVPREIIEEIEDLAYNTYRISNMMNQWLEDIDWSRNNEPTSTSCNGIEYQWEVPNTIYYSPRDHKKVGCINQDTPTLLWNCYKIENPRSRIFKGFFCTICAIVDEIGKESPFWEEIRGTFRIEELLQ